jgi:acetyltransferase-like isoleucine patch superfamily enzyme
VRIGSGSWLGANVVILPGTVLGRNTVVAAGAVVRGEFPDHVVLGGVPAKVLRHYSEENGWQSGPPSG